MTREALISSLKQKESTVVDLSKEFNRPISAIEEDIDHIRTSIRNDPNYKLLINPAQCSLCNYIFPFNKPKTPSKCPECKREKIKLAKFKIKQK